MKEETKLDVLSEIVRGKFVDPCKECPSSGSPLCKHYCTHRVRFTVTKNTLVSIVENADAVDMAFGMQDCALARARAQEEYDTKWDEIVQKVCEDTNDNQNSKKDGE